MQYRDRILPNAAGVYNMPGIKASVYFEEKFRSKVGHHTHATTLDVAVASLSVS